jgi:hypothetical protein
MSVQLFGHVEVILVPFGVDEEGVGVGRLVVGVEEVQTRFQFLNLLLLDRSFVNDVPTFNNFDQFLNQTVLFTKGNILAIP